MSTRNFALSLVLMGLMTGCGEESSDSEGQESQEDLVSDTSSYILSVSGVYDSSRTEDEAYLYISSEGNVTAYDYQGEASGTGVNCYSVVTEATQTNSSLNGGSVTYSSSTEEYTLTSTTNVLVFSYNTTDGMHDFELDSVFSSGVGLDISASNMNIKVGGDGNLQSTILISDIEAALCS